MRLIYLSHPEVEVDPELAVTDWTLSASGRVRLLAASARGWPVGIARIASSAERKARDTAALLGAGVIPIRIHAGLGEVDRSATGYVPAAAHEALADRLFARPELSADGWETARAAQDRGLAALREALLPGSGNLLVVGHGGIGTLIRCALAGLPIDRRHDQPRQGCVWTAQVTMDPAPLFRLVSPWQPLERQVADDATTPPVR